MILLYYLRFLDVFEHECSWDRVVPSQGCVFTKIILPRPVFSSIHICFCSNAPPLVFQSHHDSWNPLLNPLLLLFILIFALRWCEGERIHQFLFFFILNYIFFFIFSPPCVLLSAMVHEKEWLGYYLCILFFFNKTFSYYQKNKIKNECLFPSNPQYRYGHEWIAPD